MSAPLPEAVSHPPAARCADTGPLGSHITLCGQNVRDSQPAGYYVGGCGHRVPLVGAGWHIGPCDDCDPGAI